MAFGLAVPPGPGLKLPEVELGLTDGMRGCCGSLGCPAPAGSFNDGLAGGALVTVRDVKFVNDAPAASVMFVAAKEPTLLVATAAPATLASMFVPVTAFVAVTTKFVFAFVTTATGLTGLTKTVGGAATGAVAGC